MSDTDSTDSAIERQLLYSSSSNQSREEKKSIPVKKNQKGFKNKKI